jgi:hypothetical protein
MSTTYFGWFSQNQFDMIEECEKKQWKNSNQNNFHYIYYIDENDKIVQVTEVSKTSQYNSNFTDVQYLGKLKKFYKASDKPL